MDFGDDDDDDVGWLLWLVKGWEWCWALEDIIPLPLLLLDDVLCFPNGFDAFGDDDDVVIAICWACVTDTVIVDGCIFLRDDEGADDPAVDVDGKGLDGGAAG